jgi:hypothetical protein
MTKISEYPIITNPTEDDILIGTDVNSSDVTKNFSIGSIIDLIGDINQGPIGPQGDTGPTGPQGPVGPAGLEWQGSWNKNTSYVEDDAVGFGGASYFCILAIPGSLLNDNPENDTTHWALLASQGAIGPTGPAGPIGPQGPAGYGTLQQTVDLGNTVTGGVSIDVINGSNETIINGGSVTVLNSSNVANVSADNIFFEKQLGSGSVELKFLNTIDAARVINFPNASGTIALTSDITTKVVKTTITQAQILQMFTTPISILNSTTAGIAKIPLNILCKRSGAGTDYTIVSNQFSLVSNSGSTFSLTLNNNILSSAVPVSYTNFSFNGNFQIAVGIDNEIYKLGFYTSNPTGGTGDMDVYVTYIEFAL